MSEEQHTKMQKNSEILKRVLLKEGGFFLEGDIKGKLHLRK